MGASSFEKDMVYICFQLGQLVTAGQIDQCGFIT